LDCRSVTILGVLNKEHHQEGDDCRSSIDHQLPGVGEPKHWTGNSPNQNDKAANYECKGMSSSMGDCLCDMSEPFVQLHYLAPFVVLRWVAQ
jgi:hypothetical protein